MYLTPIQFNQVENLRKFLDESKQTQNLLCRAYEGDIYKIKDVYDYYNSLSDNEKKSFNKQNKSLLKPEELNKQWSLIYLPNFEKFVTQWNSNLYPYTQLDLGLVTNDTIQYITKRFINTELFTTIKSELSGLQTRLEAFTKINQSTAQLLSINLTENELRELSQKSPNYLSMLYKDFLKITFIQQIKLKQLLVNALNNCDKKELSRELQDWITNIDSNNSLIKAFMENAIKRMQANQAVKNSAKIRAQQLLGEDSLEEKINELSNEANTLNEFSSTLEQKMDWFIPASIWGAFGLIFITSLVTASLIFFVELSLPMVITFGVLYLASALILGFVSPQSISNYLSQQLDSLLEDNLTRSETLLEDAQFLKNYSKLDKDYLDTEENHKPMIEAIVSDLREMELAENQVVLTTVEDIKVSSLGLFKKDRGGENTTNLLAEEKRSFEIK